MIVAYRVDLDTLPAISPGDAPRAALPPVRPGSGQDVAAMDRGDRIYEALLRAPSFMDDAFAAEFQKLLVPSTIAIMVASIAALVAITLTGFGAGIILAVGWACAGWAIFDAAGHFYDFFVTINDAKTDTDLDKAAQMLANGVAAIGVGVLITFLTKGAARATSAGGKAVKEAVEEVAKTPSIDRQTHRAGKNSITGNSVSDKLDRYLLNPDHPVGKEKAKWFKQALGFEKSNSDELARQIKFDSKTAVETGINQYGTKYNQIIPITGANGKTIDVKFAWIKHPDGTIKLITGVPTKK